jgi:hypothetical protein
MQLMQISWVFSDKTFISICNRGTEQGDMGLTSGHTTDLSCSPQHTVSQIMWSLFFSFLLFILV